jgi:hypothetical protein
VAPIILIANAVVIIIIIIIVTVTVTIIYVLINIVVVTASPSWHRLRQLQQKREAGASDVCAVDVGTAACCRQRAVAAAACTG